MRRPYFHYSLLIGDCLESMAKIESNSVHCCVTSPPYFGLRDYGAEGQIGLEPTPDEFVQALVTVFREVKRVLRDDGTLWLNLGDTYSSGGRKYRDGDDKLAQRGMTTRPDDGAKPKDLLGIPWKVAFALQADGWYLRQDIIWQKPNPMPESVTDRCTKSHEYVFLLTKSPKYHFDHLAIKEEAVKGAAGSSFHKGKTAEHQLGRSSQAERVEDGKRNRRSVWSIATRPYKGAHFATFPPGLIEPCILAGCPLHGTVLDPFGGSGTTAGVALMHERNAILCELNPDYGDLVEGRVSSISGLRGKRYQGVHPGEHSDMLLEIIG